jgi:AraC-like DNA-binding protein
LIRKKPAKKGDEPIGQLSANLSGIHLILEMKYIFFIAGFNAFFFLFLLFQKRNKALHDRILGFWLAYLGLYVGSYAIIPHELFSSFPLLSSGFVSLLMLHGPFLYFYLSALVFKNRRFKKVDFLHIAPFLLFNIYLLAASHIPSLAEGISLEHGHSGVSPPLLFNFFLMLTVLSGPVYFVLSLKLFKILDKNISENFSFYETIDLDWLRKLVGIFGIIWSLLMVAAVIYHVLQLFTITFCTNGLFLSLSFFIILLGYFGLKQQEIFMATEQANFEFVPETAKKYASSGLKDSEALLLSEKLRRFMETEKPYLNPNLTLPQLASMIQTPSHYLSQVINEKFSLNFFDFINQYRIEEVKSRISDPQFKHLSLLGIAFECGFNSKSAFNRIFKKFTGTTPTSFKERERTN